MRGLPQQHYLVLPSDTLHSTFLAHIHRHYTPFQYTLYTHFVEVVVADDGGREAAPLQDLGVPLGLAAHAPAHTALVEVARAVVVTVVELRYVMLRGVHIVVAVVQHVIIAGVHRVAVVAVAVFERGGGVAAVVRGVAVAVVAVRGAHFALDRLLRHLVVVVVE